MYICGLVGLIVTAQSGLIAAAQAIGREVPDPLKKAIQNRCFHNHEIKVQVHRPQTGSNLLIEERCKGDEWLTHLLAPDVHDEWFAEPPIEKVAMVWDGRRWDSDGRGTVVHVSSALTDNGRQRLNAVGLTPFFSAQSPESLLEQLERPEFEFDTARTHEGVAVRALKRDGTGYRWLLSTDDPPRVLRCAMLGQHGVVTHEAELRYSEDSSGGFPASVTFRNSGVETDVVMVHEAAFDRTRPPLLGPAQVGVEVGTNLRVLQPDGKVKILGWDGDELRPYGEIVARIRAGELSKGPRFQKAVALTVARAQAGWYPGGTHLVSDWERYVADFIARCKLDAEQKQRAWQIHKAALESASRYTSRIKEELATIRSDLSNALASDPSTATAGRIAPLLERLAELAGPLQQIFEKEIKARLPRLLSRDQATACGTADSADESKR